MDNFPLVDAVPLPAPVVIFKILLLITSSLHFVAVEVLLGGILLAVLMNRVAPSQSRYSVEGRDRLSAAWVMAKRLPVVMTFVINFAVPPLLFNQVLYGSALYTSSVLLGAYWISIVGFLMFCYWLLYKFADRCSRGDSALWFGFLAWMAAASVGKILSMNTTLMLRPEVWQQMYSLNALGLFFAPADPTMVPRWAFMVLGGLVGAGAWMLWLGSRPSPTPSVREYLSRLGGYLLLVGVPVQLLTGYRVWMVQPEYVREASLQSGLFGVSWPLFVLCWVALWVIGFNRVKWNGSIRLSGNLTAILGVVGFFFMAVARDAIRDITLSNKGYDVWKRSAEAQTDYLILAAFLLLFIAGLCVVAWMIWVSWKSKPTSDFITEAVPAKGHLVQMAPKPLKEEPQSCSCTMSRSAFLGTALTGVGLLYAGGVSYALYRYLGRPVESVLSDTEEAPTEQTADGAFVLKDAAKIPVQSMMTFVFKRRFSVLIHHADGSWVAMDGICTHMGCKVRYEPDKDRVFCPCHDGVFDSRTGKVLSGPPEAPLPLYQVEVRGEDILIS